MTRLYLQLVEITWRQSGRSGPAAETRAALIRKTWPLADRNGAMVLQHIKAEQDQDFEAVEAVTVDGVPTKATPDQPFFVSTDGDMLEVHFNRDFENTVRQPHRFTRHGDGASKDTIWQRPSRLFTLAPGDYGKVSMNWVLGNRTLAGASREPLYERIDALIIWADDPAAALTKGPPDCCVDEIQPLR